MDVLQQRSGPEVKLRDEDCTEFLQSAGDGVLTLHRRYEADAPTLEVGEEAGTR